MLESRFLITFMKKVLIFSTAYIPFIGGAEIAVKEITDRLVSDFEFHMITLNLSGKQKKEERVGAVYVHRIGGRGKLAKLLFPFSAYQKAVELHRKESFDMIWSIMASFGGFAARFFKKKFPSVPFVLTLQEGDPIPDIEHKVRFVKPWFNEIFTLADKVQVISNYLGEWARNKGVQKPIILVPNGVDTFLFNNDTTPVSAENRVSFWKDRGIEDAASILITTSRLVQKNAVDVVIQSLPQLPHSHFVVLGEGDKLSELKMLATKLKVADRVHFKGMVPNRDIVQYLRNADIFIRPSRSEGMGNSFVEAMVAGVPVIATPVGGIVDFLIDGQTGLFCKVDDPESIVECVQTYMSNNELKESIIRNAKKMALAKYDWNLIANDMKEKVFVTF